MLSTTTNDDDEIRKSIRTFISKAIEYATKEENSTSIAFAVSDSYINEIIVAQEMIDTAKHQLEFKNLQLKISFILLPEQRTLHSQFFTLIGTMQDMYAQFDWPNTVIKITLIASQVEELTKCQEKINNYLKRCTTSKKLTNPNGIFQHWDQYTINVFYKYCKDKCVLSQIDRTTRELELIGPVNNCLEVEQKWRFLSDLAAVKLLLTPSIERSSSAAIRSEQLATKAAIEQVKVCNVMLSYCQEDSRKCQCLINKLTEEGFSIWADSVIAEQQRDIFSQIDKSTCIILCISENYYESMSCEKEARYAFQSGKQVFLVKIQNHPLIGWQREVFEGKLFFQLFGSENHFDLEYEKLLLEILQYIKLGNTSLLQQRSNRQQENNEEHQTLLTAEKRRSLYEKKIRTLTDIGRIDEKEMKTLVKQLQSVLTNIDEDGNELKNETEGSSEDPSSDENSSELVKWIKRWLRKPTNITKQNLPPFSASGDINDAVFPMPDYVLKYLNQYVESFSLTQSSPVKLHNVFECDIVKRSIEQPSKRVLFGPTYVDKERTYGICTQKVEYVDGLSQVFATERITTDDDSPKPTRLPVLLPEIPLLKKNQMISRHKPDDLHKMKKEQKEVTKYSAKKYIPLTRQELKTYFEKFAQRMQENAIQFEIFCSTTATVARQLRPTE
ncbi:unnamed protein product [Rotaria sp. Silwood2]|nr:unnamed protein product [Rotaria sp. Silwood2]CAF4270780.1 unnamed protein product [Rotaria sp. Silwood2]